ncbi:TIGR02453 family protein [Salipiger mucosus]|uniref:TIGR02453 family protein n=1 Tax=Salipiger mucosus DSM 16094 TaxID=1123237 RepID=S9QGI7_9RHOB|nr:TIGR02453 family protein [Salipiger mucosus]EPX78703.1 hypothetical protein Salmuc_04285 [Salipiger mucosus DSM 16094]
MTAYHIDLSEFAPRARAFLEELEAQNTRAWFRANKARYDAELKRPAERLLHQVAAALAKDAGQPVRSKLFRPHRDVRFSADKTPYHAHLHAAWSVSDGRGWYFGLAPGYATAGAGIMRFDTEQMAHWQEAVRGDTGASLEGLLAEMGARLDPPAPDAGSAPDDEAHPRADLLKRTGLVVWKDDLFETLSPDPTAALTGTFARMQPLQHWLASNL